MKQYEDIDSVFDQDGEKFLEVSEFFDVEENSRILLPQQAFYAIDIAEEHDLYLSLAGINYLTVGAARKLVEAEENGVELYDCTKIVERDLQEVRGEAK